MGLLDYEYSNLTTDFVNMDLKQPYLNYLMETSELFFTIVFTLEMTIKMLAMGVFLDKNCYLRD